MDIRINSVEYKEYPFEGGVVVYVDFTINCVIKANITIYDEKRLGIGEIINYIRRELGING